MVGVSVSGGSGDLEVPAGNPDWSQTLVTAGGVVAMGDDQFKN